MSDRSAQVRDSIIAGSTIVVASLTLLFGSKLMLRPDVVYEFSPSYNSTLNAVTTLDFIVTNVGRSTAKEVVIKYYSDKQIIGLQIETPEVYKIIEPKAYKIIEPHAYKIEKDGQNYVHIGMDRLVSSAKIKAVIEEKLHNPPSNPRITITYSDGMGTERKEGKLPSGLILVCISILFLFAFEFFITRAVYRKSN